MTGLRTTLADGAAADPVLGIEDDHALIAVIFAVQSEEGDLVCRHFREGEELLRRNEQVKVAGGLTYSGRPRTSETPLEKRTDSSMTVMVNLPPVLSPTSLKPSRTDM